MKRECCSYKINLVGIYWLRPAPKPRAPWSELLEVAEPQSLPRGANKERLLPGKEPLTHFHRSRGTSNPASYPCPPSLTIRAVIKLSTRGRLAREELAPGSLLGVLHQPSVIKRTVAAQHGLPQPWKDIHSMIWAEGLAGFLPELWDHGKKHSC